MDVVLINSSYNDGNTTEVGKSIVIMTLHSILWFVLFLTIERKKENS